VSDGSVINPYKILQVDPEAEFEVIEAAYRRLARKYHPDISDTPETHERMVAINHAWDQLRTPERRATVDRARARAAIAAAAPPPAEPTRDASPGAAPRPAGPGTHRGHLAGHAVRSASAPGDGSLRAAAQPRPEDELQREQRRSAGSPTGLGGEQDVDDAWAGPAPGNPSGTVLAFGRYRGWSLGEISRHDTSYLEWLERSPAGRPYRTELDALLRARGRRGQT